MALPVDDFRRHVLYGAAEGVGLILQRFFGKAEVSDGDVTAGVLVIKVLWLKIEIVDVYGSKIGGARLFDSTMEAA